MTVCWKWKISVFQNKNKIFTHSVGLFCDCSNRNFFLKSIDFSHLAMLLFIPQISLFIQYLAHFTREWRRLARNIGVLYKRTIYTVYDLVSYRPLYLIYVLKIVIIPNHREKKSFSSLNEVFSLFLKLVFGCCDNQ